MRFSQVIGTVVLLYICLAKSVLSHEGHHGTTGEKPTSFNDPKITQDEAHLKEHLKDEINMDQKMSPEQMEFHYFRIHDVNNDTNLDGLEILAAMSHMMPPPELQLHEKLGKSKEQIDAIMAERQAGMMKYYEDVIDRVLHDDDTNKDGYLNYAEFIRARRRDQYHQQKMMEEQVRQQEMHQFQQFQQFQAMQAQQGQMPQGQPPMPQGQPPMQQGQPPMQQGQPPMQPPSGQQQQQQQQTVQYQQNNPPTMNKP